MDDEVVHRHVRGLVPAKQGFGTRLITGGVSREPGGTVQLALDSAGLRCSIDVPLDKPDRFTSFGDPAELRTVGTA